MKCIPARVAGRLPSMLAIPFQPQAGAYSISDGSDSKQIRDGSPT